MLLFGGILRTSRLNFAQKKQMTALKRFLDKIFRHLYFNILVVLRIEFPAKTNRNGNETMPENEV